MAVVVLLVLALLWAAVLLPPLYRSRVEKRRGDALSGFHYRSERAGRDPFASSSSGPGDPGSYRPGAVLGWSARSEAPGAAALPRVPGALTPAQRRRREVLGVLIGAALVTLVGAALMGMTLLWALHVIVDLLLVAYVVLLVQMVGPAPRPRARPRVGAPPAPPALRRPPAPIAHTRDHVRPSRRVPHRAGGARAPQISVRRTLTP